MYNNTVKKLRQLHWLQASNASLLIKNNLFQSYLFTIVSLYEAT